MSNGETTGGGSDDMASIWDDFEAIKRSIPEENTQREKYFKNTAKDCVLPYLTLESMSDEDISDVLDFLKDEIEITDSEHKMWCDDYPFELIKRIDTLLSNFGDTSTIKMREACKLLYATTIDYANKQRETSSPWKEESSFIDIISQFAADTCSLGDFLELVDVAEQTEVNSHVYQLYSQIMYNNYTDNDYSNVFSGRNTISSLRLIPVLYNMTRYFVGDDDEYSVSIQNKVNNALWLLADNDSTSPLVKLSAKSYGESLNNDNTLANLQMLGIFDELSMVRFSNNQWEKDANGYITIAPGVVASINDDDRINELEYKDGRSVSLLDYRSVDSVGLDRDSAFLISTAHVPRVKNLICEKLGLDLTDIPLESQIHLLKFMTEADNERFDRLCFALNGTDEKIRLKLAKGFLAAGFGEDFGDALLDIANSDVISSEQLGEILDKIDSCRKSIRGITGFYDGFDGGDFAKQYERAANERLTDALAVFREIAKTRHVSADLGWAGTPEFNYETAMEALNYEAKSLEIISSTLSDIEAKKEGAFAERILAPDKYRRRSEYRLYSPDHGYVLLYTRSEGSGAFSSDLEYGKHGNKYRYNNSSGVEASISFITNPENPFEYPNPHKPNFKRVKEDEGYYNPETMDKVSAIRLDREGRAPNAPADDPNRDPINMVGTVSVDLAAINDRWDTPSGKIARLFSVGGALRTKITGAESALNHNTHYFDQDKYGRASGFKELVDYTDNIVLEWCKDAPLDKKYDSALLAIQNMPDSRLAEVIRVYNGLSNDEKKRVDNILPIELVRGEMKRRAKKRGGLASVV